MTSRSAEVDDRPSGRQGEGRQAWGRRAEALRGEMRHRDLRGAGAGVDDEEVQHARLRVFGRDGAGLVVDPLAEVEAEVGLVRQGDAVAGRGVREVEAGPQRLDAWACV